jgi:hypothetical protein
LCPYFACLSWQIPLYSSTNNTSWIDSYCQDDVDTMDALILSIQMVLVGFVLHMVGGLYVAMLRARILLKQEEGASNMATRSQLALWMDAVISVLCLVFAKDMEATVYAMSSIYNIMYSGAICADHIILQLTSPAQ